MDDELNEVTEEQQEALKKLERIRIQNHRMKEELNQVGIAADVSNARIEHLVSYLRDKGVISLDDQLEEQMNWELNLRGQLQPVLQRVKQANGQPVRRDSGIVIPGQNGVPRMPHGKG